MIKKFLVLAMCLLIFVGCSSTDTKTEPVLNETTKIDESTMPVVETTTAMPEAIQEYSAYMGYWKLRVGDEALYSLTSFENYYGATGIYIEEVHKDKVKGTLFTVQGAPSYRYAEIQFEGQMSEGILKTTFKDEAWEYSGQLELTFKADSLSLHSVYDPSDNTPFWGIPEGDFEFDKAIETRVIVLDDAVQKKLENFLFPLSTDYIKVMDDGPLTDIQKIEYVALNVALGNIDPLDYGEATFSDDGFILYDEAVANAVSLQYFGSAISTHQSAELAAYSDHKYTVPAVGGPSAFPVIEIVMEDQVDHNTWYVVVDEKFESPEEEAELEVQYLIKLTDIKGAYQVEWLEVIDEPIYIEDFYDYLESDS